MYENKFTKWQKFKHKNILDDLNYPGVYTIAYSENSLMFKAFSWRKEIVYIGMTNSKKGLGGRLMQFYCTLHGSRNHGGASRFLFKHKKPTEFLEKLYVSIAPFTCDVTSNKPDDLNVMGDIVKFEYSCLAQYAAKFGCLPEFNDKKRSPKK